MNVLFSDQSLFQERDKLLVPSIFLAGPTPRKDSTLSWRIEAIKILEDMKFFGTVLVPERRDWKVKFDYTDQVEWEEEGLASASSLVFWVPRKAPDMLALTTNIEFGRWLVKRGQRMVYGRPDTAENVRYLDWLFGIEQERAPFNNLYDTLLAAVNRCQS